MKVLWVCNIMLPQIAIHIDKDNIPTGGGWMSGFMDGVVQSGEVELAVAFPMQGGDGLRKGEVPAKDGSAAIRYYGFSYRLYKPEQYFPELEAELQEAIADFQPDILHVFGTEYAHSLSAVRAFQKPTRTVVNIQGLCSIYAKHYMGDVPVPVQKRYTLRDMLRADNLNRQRLKFVKRGEFEIEALRMAGHVIGRTDWDKACTQQINPMAKYHFLNETLRSSFYTHMGEWKLENCERGRIFLSRGEFPIKGFHYMLQAMPEVLKGFPEAKIYIAGGDVTRCQTLKEKLRVISYGKYLRKLICDNHLEDKVIFMGYLDEEAMCQAFLKSHVFVSPSTIENESNSISEAKMLGVPVVASFVGGVTDRIAHKEDGFLYQHDAVYMLAYYIRQLLGDDELARRFSGQAQANAKVLHDREHNFKAAIEIYRNIMK